MKKNKLYTVNTWNRPAFMQEANLFDIGGGTSNIKNRMSTAAAAATAQAGKPKNVNAGSLNFGNDGKGGNGAGIALASSALDAIGGIVNNTKYGQKKTAVGSALKSIAPAATAINPYLGLAVTAGSIIADGGFGYTFNEEGINNVKSNTAGIRSSVAGIGNASTTEDLANRWGQTQRSFAFDKDYIGEDGWFTDEVANKYRELKRDQARADLAAADALAVGAENVDNTQDSNIMRRFAAFGGPIGVMPQPTPLDTIGSAAVNYDFMSDYLTTKRKQADNKNSTSNVFASMPNKAFAFGGDMQTNSADFLSGLTHVNAGGTHEESPYDGVQMGTDSEGVPNLVEEGETIFDDYVYSNRILCDEITKKKFHLPKKKDITYAELSKKLEKEISERPNDPISRAGFKIQMHNLAEQQERQKQEMEAARAREAFEALSPEEQVAVMDNAARQEAMAEEAAMQQEVMAQQQAQPSPEEVAMMQQQIMQEQAVPEEQMAYGGNLFAGGGELALNWLKENNDLNLSDDELKSIASAMGKYIEKNYSNLSPDSINMRSVYSKFFKGWSTTPDAYGQNYRDMRSAGISKNTALKMLKARKQWSKDSKENDKQWETITAKWEPKGTSQNSNNKYSAPLSEYKVENGKRVVFPHNGILYPTAEAANKAAGRQKYAVRKDTVQKQAASVATQDTSTNEKPMTEAPTQNAQRSSSVKGTSSKSNSVGNRGDIVAHKYDWYRNGSDGYSTPWGFTVGNDGLIKQEDYTDDYKNLVETLTADDIRKWAADHPQDPSLLSFLAKGNKLEDLTTDQWRKGATDGKYGFMHHVGSSMLKDKSVLDELGVDQTVLDASAQEAIDKVNGIAEDMNHIPRVYHALEGDDDYLPDDQNEWSDIVGEAIGEPVVVNEHGDTVIYHKRKTPAGDAVGTDAEREIVPIHRAEWPRYAGLFGPAVGLGMMAAGVGKPDYSELDAAVDRAGNIALADYKPIGNYLAYNPMDIWYEQNRMDANARATDRAILNNAAPVGTKMAGLLASGYNNQIASGDLYRKALEYNDAKRHQVGEFNRGTDMFNAQAYNQNQQFNASALNQGRLQRASLAMQAAQEKLNRDAGWYNSLYGNVAGLFKGASDLGRENYQYNQMVDLLGSGAMPGITEDKLVKAGLYRYAKKGGKIRKKKRINYLI